MYNASSCACLHVVHYSVANEESVWVGKRLWVALDRGLPVPSGPTAKLYWTLYGVVCTAEVSLFPVDPLPNYWTLYGVVCTAEVPLFPVDPLPNY